ncbi:Tn3 family transposase [Microtetraspora sp. NBRC 13810]|uniref:Tn3 family transposase n=1 Tax=Microtetraspora sp. NBRC 13810 TaxID=3030990 RepID=UPI00255792A4|nr:Tn3 family transposase [Microtetraspora sp. NBRC 13810]
MLSTWPNAASPAAVAIRKAAQAKDNPADLINVALEELVRAECELPGYTTLDEMTKKIRTEVNRGFFTLLSSRVDSGAQARLARLLLVDPITRRSAYDGLKDAAQAVSLNKFKGRLAFLRGLDAPGPTEAWLEGIPPGKIAHFAGEARVTDVADLRKVLDEDKGITLIVSLLHTARTGVRRGQDDHALAVFVGDLCEQITQVTDRNESFHNFADWLMFGGKLIGHNDPDYHEKIITFDELPANCVIYSTARDITDAANASAADGHPVDLDDLATVSPYITHVIRRFGNWILNLTPPVANPTTRLDLESLVLFAP